MASPTRSVTATVGDNDANSSSPNNAVTPIPSTGRGSVRQKPRPTTTTSAGNTTQLPRVPDSSDAPRPNASASNKPARAQPDRTGNTPTQARAPSNKESMPKGMGFMPLSARSWPRIQTSQPAISPANNAPRPAPHQSAAAGGRRRRQPSHTNAASKGQSGNHNPPRSIARGQAPVRATSASQIKENAARAARNQKSSRLSGVTARRRVAKATSARAAAASGTTA